MGGLIGNKKEEYLFHMALGEVIDTLSREWKMDEGACTCVP